MDYKAIVVDELKDYERRRVSIENLKAQILEIETEIRGVKGADPSKVSVRFGGAGREDKLLSLIVTRDHLRVNLRVAASKVRRIEKGLAAIREQDREVLRLFYIDRQPGYLEDACEILGVEAYSSVYAAKDEALRRLTVACYGVTEL